jgi:Tol biopolymer transport system component
MVQPVQMELFVLDLATKKSKQITQLGGANWAPYYLSDNKRIIFSSDFNATAASFGAFNLYVINEDGTGLEQVTFAEGNFDSFPVSPLVFAIK